MKRYGLLSVFAALVLTACGNGSVKSPDFESQLQSIAVTPGTATVGAGESQQFKATGTFSAQPGAEPTSRDITDSVDWSSSSASVATVDPKTGLAVGGTGKGEATITASRSGKQGTAKLNGEGLVLRSLVISPAQQITEPNGSKQFSVQGKYSDGTVKDVSDTVVNWSLTPAALGTISPTQGKTVTIKAGAAVGAGTVEAKVTDPAVTPGSAQFIVGQIVSLNIVPATATSPNGVPFKDTDGKGFKAMGTFASPTGSDQFTSEVSATWKAENEDAAGAAPALAVNCDDEAAQSCIVTGHAEGKVKITATAVEGSVDPATAELTVTPGVLSRIDITTTPSDSTDAPATPSTLTLPLDGAQQLYPLYIYSDDGVPVYGPRNASEAVNWASSKPGTVAAIAAADNSVIATPVAQGSADITATSGTLNDKLTINVGPPAIKSITRIEPSIGYARKGGTVTYIAYGLDTVTNEERIAKVTWSSADASIATINASSGVATAVGEVGQQTTITATLIADPTKKATATLVINPDSCITPLLAAQGATATEGTAANQGSAGVCLLCSVSNPGNVINANPDDAGNITVAVGALNAYRSIDVTGSVDAPSYTLPFAAGSRPAFIVRNPTGPLVLAEVLSQIEMSTLLNGVPQESTSSLTPLRLDLLGLGLIDNKSAGLVSFTTSKPYDGIRIKLRGGLATALSTVDVMQACATSQPPLQPASGIGRLAASGWGDTAEPTLEVGATLAFVAYDYADTAQQLNADDVKWESLDPGVATISASGVVTAVGAGETTIRATLKNTSICGANCSYQRKIKVTAAICEMPLLKSGTAEITSKNAGLCIGCSAQSLDNVIDAYPETYGSVFPAINLLGASVTVTVTAKPPYAVPFKGGVTAGFVLSATSGKVLTAGIGSSIVVSTLNGGVPTGDASNSTAPLRLDLLGVSAVGSVGAHAQPLFIDTVSDFDALRITFNGGLLDAELGSEYRLYTACANSTLK